jgi:hypothetical protein
VVVEEDLETQEVLVVQVGAVVMVVHLVGQEIHLQQVLHKEIMEAMVMEQGVKQI